MTLSYDATTDTLYLAFERAMRGPQFHQIESTCGDIYRIDDSRNVIVGCTVLDFFRRCQESSIDLPEIGPVHYDPEQLSLFDPQEA